MKNSNPENMIVDIDSCCGCGSCAAICPKNCIKMDYDESGFLYPKISTQYCISCGRCKHVCPMINNLDSIKSSFGLQAYYGRMSDENKLSEVSSGGFASAIAELVIRNGGIVYGASYSDDFSRVEVVRSMTLKETERLRGSKYIQSEKNNIYKKISEDIKLGKTVLYIGLPCEVAALKLFLGKNYDNLITVDLVCHGPTSKYVFDEYIKSHNKNRDIVCFSMRYKLDKKWTPYYMMFKYKDGNRFVEQFWGSEFGYIFGRFARPNCYSCKFKGKDHCSDFTVGDAWGDGAKGIVNDNLGLSTIIINSEKGYELIKQMSDFRFFPAELTDVVNGNPNLIKCRECNAESDFIGKNLRILGIKKIIKIIKPLKKQILDDLHMRKDQLCIRSRNR